MDEFAAELNRYWIDRGRREQLQGLESLGGRLVEERLSAEAALNERDRMGVCDAFEDPIVHRHRGREIAAPEA